MAKIARKFFKQFGVNANPASDIGQFGSLAAASPTFTNDIDTIQGLAAWLTGWTAETIATNRPALEDFNAVDFVYAYMLAYMFQAGIPEYDASTTYYTGSYCQVAGVIYKSKTDTNVGNTPSSSPTQWDVCIDLVTGGTPTGSGADWYGGNGTPPTGWLVCDGSAVSRSTYAALFAVIGTTFGVGNGTTTFNLPDSRARVIVGYKSGDSDFGTIGATPGEKTHTLDLSEIPSHSHGLNTSGGRGLGYTDNGFDTVSGSTGAAGGGLAHNNIQPSLVATKIIKT